MERCLKRSIVLGKIIAQLLVFAAFACTSSALAESLQLVTKCRGGDCFTYGWSTEDGEGIFRLTCACKQYDCQRFGWTSDDTAGSSYDVTCKAGGCFVDGWTSVESVGTITKNDDISCKNSACLINGWDIRTDYDNGGTVACLQDNCRTIGGIQYWREHLWQTNCVDADCYHRGWISDIYQ